MSTIKNRDISLYCHFNKIIKGPATSFQSLALSQKHVRNVCHTTHQHLTKFHFDIGFRKNKHKCNFHHVAMFMMTSQMFKSVKFSKTEIQVSQEHINYFIAKNSFVLEVIFNQLTRQPNFICKIACCFSAADDKIIPE